MACILTCHLVSRISGHGDARYRVMRMPPAARMITTAQAGSFQTLSKKKPVSARANSWGPRMALVKAG